MNDDLAGASPVDQPVRPHSGDWMTALEAERLAALWCAGQPLDDLPQWRTAMFVLLQTLDQKRAEYEDLKQCHANNVRNIVQEATAARDLLHRMIEAPTTQISASWKDAARQALALWPNVLVSRQGGADE